MGICVTSLLSALVQRGAFWLVESFPRLVYAGAVEKLIGAASEIAARLGKSPRTARTRRQSDGATNSASGQIGAVGSGGNATPLGMPHGRVSWQCTVAD